MVLCADKWAANTKTDRASAGRVRGADQPVLKVTPVRELYIGHPDVEPRVSVELLFGVDGPAHGRQYPSQPGYARTGTSVRSSIRSDSSLAAAAGAALRRVAKRCDERLTPMRQDHLYIICENFVI
jgi:hypothetical protein